MNVIINVFDKIEFNMKGKTHSISTLVDLDRHVILPDAVTSIAIFYQKGDLIGQLAALSVYKKFKEFNPGTEFTFKYADSQNLHT